MAYASIHLIFFIFLFPVHALAQNNGNFIINGESDNRWLWESFKLPADTLLPLHELEPGKDLISRRSETNLSRGRFHLILVPDGNLVLTTKSVPTNADGDTVYFETKTSDTRNSD
ncbi:hypothetical protein ACH5RR_009351 [Cinchona calisaya]|uniref:Uncharacterized protein n=1 Tax=Cinchona calisaya TaxID=153742 RepID=A0ABD3AFS7_9GENT